MIRVSRLNGSEMVVNADLIEFLESTPDTLVSLTTGRKLMVREPMAEVVRRILEYRGQCRAYPVPVGGDGSNI